MTERWTRSAIVTGASHGIGAAVAERLALDGLAVVVNYSSGSDEAAALVAPRSALIWPSMHSSSTPSMRIRRR